TTYDIVNMVAICGVMLVLLWYFQRFDKGLDEVFINVQSCEQRTICNDLIAEKFFSIIVHYEQETYEAYCAYAHHVGFSVRKDHNSYWPNYKKRKSKDFLCAKVGHKKESNLMNTEKYKKTDIRTGCQVMVRYVVYLEGNWTVHKFIESLNHPLVEYDDKHILRSSRRISDLNAGVLRLMTGAGIGATDAYNFIALEVGGAENLECTKKDAFNFIQRERREKIE
ncbi:uncharacterized protein LOC110038324, partial [Phalaenopsis equestris]|uniref:uncharacterized protein LOC110038324 n=1 Tax=Phalaenopsis equestris TaxID=78828 RepID=UPI0009E25553